VFNRGALALSARAELSEWKLVADDVVVGSEDVVPDSTDVYGLRSTPGQLGEMSREGGDFRADSLASLERPRHRGVASAADPALANSRFAGSSTPIGSR
jgi:hypothetical protein